MWTTFALVAVLGLPPADSGRLALTNIRTTYGVLGMPRHGTKFLPGDEVVIAFDVEGMTVDDSGKVLYSVAMEVTDDKGDVKFRQAPHKLEANNSLGGNRIPAFAHLRIGLDQPKGTYKVKVTVKDLAGNASKSMPGSYEVLPPDFGLVRLTTTGDPQGMVPLPFPAEGQSMWVRFGAVGFERDKSSRQPNIEVTLSVRDEDGNPTLRKPMSGTVVKDVPAKARGIPMQFMLELNRAGKFTVELNAKDKVSGKTAKLSFPLTVQKAK